MIQEEGKSKLIHYLLHIEDFDEINTEENEKEIKNKQMNEEKIKTNQEIELIEDTINLNNNSPLNNVIDLNIKNKKYKNILNKSKRKKENKLLILEDKKENIENNDNRIQNTLYINNDNDNKIKKDKNENEINLIKEKEEEKIDDKNNIKEENKEKEEEKIEEKNNDIKEEKEEIINKESNENEIKRIIDEKIFNKEKSINIEEEKNEEKEMKIEDKKENEEIENIKNDDVYISSDEDSSIQIQEELIEQNDKMNGDTNTKNNEIEGKLKKISMNNNKELLSKKREIKKENLVIKYLYSVDNDKLYKYRIIDEKNEVATIICDDNKCKGKAIYSLQQKAFNILNRHNILNSEHNYIQTMSKFDNVYFEKLKNTNEKFIEVVLSN